MRAGAGGSWLAWRLAQPQSVIPAQETELRTILAPRRRRGARRRDSEASRPRAAKPVEQLLARQRSLRVALVFRQSLGHQRPVPVGDARRRDLAATLPQLRGQLATLLGGEFFERPSLDLRLGHGRQCTRVWSSV